MTPLIFVHQIWFVLTGKEGKGFGTRDAKEDKYHWLRRKKNSIPNHELISDILAVEDLMDVEIPD